MTVARHLHAGVVEYEIDDEHQYGDDDGYTQSSLADDGSQGGSDEEEQQAGQGEGELLDGLNLMTAIVAVQIADIIHLHVHVGHDTLYIGEGILHGELLF